MPTPHIYLAPMEGVTTFLYRQAYGYSQTHAGTAAPCRLDAVHSQLYPHTPRQSGGSYK